MISNQDRLVQFFGNEMKRWQDHAESQGIFASTGNTLAAIACREIASEIANSDYSRAREYLNELSVNEPDQASEAQRALLLIP